MRRVRKGVAACVDLVRANVRYLLDGGVRTRIREALKRDGMTRAQKRLVASEITTADPRAVPYAGLSPAGLALTGIRVVPGAPAQLNLLVGELREGKVFAGIHTAIMVARALAEQERIPIRIVFLDFSPVGEDDRAVGRYLKTEYGLEVEIVRRERIRAASFGDRDLWLATHWKTAHAAQVACVAGRIDPARTLYLIQDYEPGFSAWSTESVVAAATYRAGFTPIVNSRPLWSYLTQHEKLDIPSDLVFAPRFDEGRQRAAASARKTTDPRTVLFYARPSKHRNLFGLGVSALRIAARSLGAEARDIRFVSAGEEHEAIDLGPGIPLTALGRLSWDDYFDLLSRSSVLLSLQASPHPSHPPFDGAISGAIAITNEFAGTRTGLHPRLRAVDTDPRSLADGVVEALRAYPPSEGIDYLAVEDGLLGNDLETVLAAAMSRLRSD